MAKIQCRYESGQVDRTRDALSTLFRGDSRSLGMEAAEYPVLLKILKAVVREERHEGALLCAVLLLAAGSLIVLLIALRHLIHLF